MAVVYRATHGDRAEPVALKLIDARTWSDEAREQFEQEARLAAAVAHRHILPVYEAGEHDGQPFVAMKLESCDLGALLRREGRLSPWRATALVSQVASALDAAHAHGLVHRDVKPSNVLFDEDEGEDRAYLADFGVARAAFSGGPLLGDMVGTVGYASPEQIRGEPLDDRTDVYGLGCLLYECLTGRVPFARGTSLATLWAHLHEEPPAPSLLVPELPAALDAVVACALAKDPRARYGSAGTLAEAALEAVRGPRQERKPVTAQSGELPSGTVTFLFTDVEGSTRLLRSLGEEAYAVELAEHRRVVRQACAREGGVEVDAQGDAFFLAFASAQGALAAASALTSTLASGPLRVRVGVHSGTPHLTSEGYVGVDVHRAARIAGAGHGGQVVVSASTAELVRASGSEPQALPPAAAARHRPAARASGSEPRALSAPTLVSLGAHRLKDFDEPVTLYQLGEGSFPPLKTIANTNLPTPASSFLGREAELYEAGLLLQDARLVTVTGPGGAGKTRFCLELARRAREERFSDYEDGVFSCFLASLRDPSLVLPTIAQTLSVSEQPGRSAAETLSEQLEGKKVLLLLDNLEHLLVCAHDLGELVAACPGLTLLLTSRELVRLQGELAYELPPLADEEGVALFCERARVEPSQAIGELCLRLEGLPLAIELAAARLHLLSPEQLLQRLSQRLDLLKGTRDVDPRQQTLRATIQWSYELLTPEEQRLFAALSVFAGGCTLEAAEEVAAADLDTLGSLLDKSLLRRSESESGPRFWMLETIREFAAELLEREDEAEGLRLRHVTFFTELAERAHPELRGPNRSEWLERVRPDLENARAALGSPSVSVHQSELQLRLAAALRLFWDAVGSPVEGLRWIEQGLGRVQAPAPRLRCDACIGAGAFASQLGDFAKAFDYDARALAAARELADPALEATALMRTAIDKRRAGELPRARALYEQALALAEEGGDDHLAGAITHNLGDLALSEGDFERAHALFRTALDGARARSDPNETAYALCNLALASFRLDEARVAGYLREALTIIGGLSWPFGVVYSVELAGDALAAEDPDAAARLLAVAEQMRAELDLPLDPFEHELHDESAATVRRSLDAERYSEACEAGSAMTGSDAVGYALDRLQAAELAARAR